MERSNASRRNDPVWQRIDSIQMSANEREQAKELLARAENWVDLAVDGVRAIRSLFTPAKRALQQ